jgi:hypothetical protein
MWALATTRFTDETLAENKRWREKNNWEGCIYGIPKRIGTVITPGKILMVLEMNNSRNVIEGIGLVKNIIVADKHYKIYSDGNYNRYTYKSKYRIDISELSDQEKKYVAIFHVLLFRCIRHVKRQQGITKMPDWIVNSKVFDFTAFFKGLFERKYENIVNLI